MGVGTGATAARWSVALGGTVAVALAPLALAHLPVNGSGRGPNAVVRAASTASVPHEGLAETSGLLGLPDLPRLGSVAALFGSTTRARVWWDRPGRWRVDTITATGEHGTYARRGVLRTWDFEHHRAATVSSVSPLRLPRTDDLLPPQLAHRILSGADLAQGKLVALAARRVAGRSTDGVRLTPPAAASTVSRVEIWADVETGLALEVRVYAKGYDDPVLQSRFLDVTMRPPDAADLRPKVPSDAFVESVVVPDLASAVDFYAPFLLPPALAGMARSRDLVTVGGSSTYGRGLARFIVLPLPPRLGRQALTAATDGGGAPLDLRGGTATVIATPLLNAVVASGEAELDDTRDRRVRSYLVAGTVDTATLTAAVEDLLTQPPPIR